MQPTILLVEDDLAIQENLAALLEDEGYRVVCASNGLEALNHLRQDDQTPQLILLDLMMPIMTGWELRARLLQNDSLAQIPVVILSAVRDVEKHADTLAAAAFVEKPIQLHELFSCVEQLTHASTPPASPCSPISPLTCG